CLFDGTWVGLPDFLLRTDTPSDLGAWSYEVVDTKLARSAKGGAVLQISLYSDLLTQTQGAQPERMALALGGPDARTEWFRVADFAAYYRSAKARFEALMAEGAGAAPPLPVAPDPVEFCPLCDWKQRCDRERREVDHLSLVAGISRGHREALRASDVDTMAGLAGVDLAESARRRREGGVRLPIDDISPASLERIREQARVQVEGRERDEPVHELLQPVVTEQGLAALPEPSSGDLFFDIEADPYAFVHGLEYLFGYCDARGDFESIWALDPVQEKDAFERFVDLVGERRERFPDLHVYHYGHYETTALKRLMGRHATREDEIDALLRGGVFVDLHRVVKQALRASVESYSIKKLEPFYGFTRDVDLRDANSALGHFEAWLQMGGAGGGPGADAEGADADADATELLRRIEGYNRDDCVSTLRLRDWLESLRPDLEALAWAPVPRPEPRSEEPPESVREEVGEVAELVERLTAGVPLEEDERSEEERARWLLAQLLGFHRREAKSTWWEFYNRCAYGDDELLEDRATMGLLEYVG
ncbi:MAG TPA: TM0106 family RecB-like putative nuclease, partial [Thermoanaerobaculia bacterium]|nr:TM0106 family RecB-like putative nuclease [Thermoanaerobaculia bacterium]